MVQSRDGKIQQEPLTSVASPKNIFRWKKICTYSSTTAVYLYGWAERVCVRTGLYVLVMTDSSVCGYIKLGMLCTSAPDEVVRHWNLKPNVSYMVLRRHRLVLNWIFSAEWNFDADSFHRVYRVVTWTYVNMRSFRNGFRSIHPVRSRGTWRDLIVSISNVGRSRSWNGFDRHESSYRVLEAPDYKSSALIIILSFISRTGGKDVFHPVLFYPSRVLNQHACGLFE